MCWCCFSSKDFRALTDFSLAESSDIRSNGFLAGAIPSTNTCSQTENGSTLQMHPNISRLWHLQLEGTQSNACSHGRVAMETWLIEGCPVVFLFEVVSRPQREEKRLRRLLKVRGMAWFRFLMLLSVRADTCQSDNYRKPESSGKGYLKPNYKIVWLSIQILIVYSSWSEIIHCLLEVTINPYPLTTH